MIKYLLFHILFFGMAYPGSESVIRDHVTIKIYPYEHEKEMRASAMPELKPESELMAYKRRFEYLIINVPEIHQPDKAEERMKIFGLYPDTLEMKRQYLDQFIVDQKLVAYFEESVAHVYDRELEPDVTYVVDELMEVASKFFYCDQVRPDTTVQVRICVGINGVNEANWEKDYRLLEAFCFEAIFNGLDREDSQIWDVVGSKKEESSQLHRGSITSLDQYLEDVKSEMFERMKINEFLKQELLSYYKLNENNLAFRIRN